MIQFSEDQTKNSRTVRSVSFLPLNVVRNVGDLVQQDIVQYLHGGGLGGYAVHAVQLLCRLVAQQQSRQRGDGQLHGVVRLGVGKAALPVAESHRKAPVVPGQEVVLHVKAEHRLRLVRVAFVAFEELRHVYYPAHGIGADSFLDVAVVQLEGYGLAVVVVSAHLVYHGIMRVNELPQTPLRLVGEVDHLLDVHDVVVYQVHHVAVGHIVVGIVHRHPGVVLVPAPVFLPGEIVAVKAAVGLLRELRVELHEFLVVPLHAADIARLLYPARYLRILDDVGHLVGDYLPAQPPVQRNGIGIQQRERAVVLTHARQALYHQALHNAVPGVLRIGADAGHESHRVFRTVNVHLQRIHRELRHQVVPVKAAQHVRPLQHRELRALYLVVLPAGFGKLLLRDLECVSQQRVVLVDILYRQRPHRVIFFIVPAHI